MVGKEIGKRTLSRIHGCKMDMWRGWGREWGGDEYGTYPPALPKWEGGLLRDGCSNFPCKATFVREGISFSHLGDIVPEA